MHSWFRALTAAAGLIVLAPGGSFAQSTPAGNSGASRPAAATTPAPGSELQVFFVSMGAGDEVWDRFGHAGIWVYDRVRGTSIVYNWGVFDFQQDRFIVRFMQGDMWYRMDGESINATVDRYRSLNRSMWTQELNLTPAQRLAVRDFIAWNMRPENQYYHYDYYRDNCSTRVRDIFDRVLSGQIRAQTENRPAGTTFREETKRIMQGDLPMYTSIMTIIGHPVDRPLSVWEDMFLPLRMRDALRAVTVRDSSGASVPLVIAEQQMIEATRPPEPTAAPSYVLPFTCAGVLVGLVLIALGWNAAVGRSWARVGYATIGLVWSLVIGFVGTVIALGWAFTDHIVMRQNENLLVANPVPLLSLVLLALFLRGRRAGQAVVLTTAVAAALGLAAFLLQIFPTFSQPNGEIIGLFVPIHVGMAAATWLRVRADAGRHAHGSVM